jgi:hypothetical protein
LRNGGDQPCALTVRFLSSARPYSWGGEDQVHLPLSASVLENWSAIQGRENNPYQECDQFAGHPSENSQPIVCHYLEPEESEAGVRDSRGPLLIPCIDLYHPDRRGGLAKHLIRFMKELRQLVRSFGKEKAIFTSDCGFTSFVQWADGDAADHESMWRELYREPPVRYSSALGGKPWLPCLCRPMGFWGYQVDLAKKTGAGVSLSNGWMEYAGLSRLIPAARERILKDLAELRGLRAKV